MSFALYQPLIYAGALFGLLTILASVLDARRGPGQGDTLRNAAFLVALLAAAWLLVLLVLVLFDFPNTFVDMLTIIAIVVVFFAALVGVLFFLFEVLFSRGPRHRRRASPEP